jgi:chaperonin GroEL (HSP60 family)
VEVQEGMDIDRGYISPQFVNNPERLLVEYDNCRVLVTDQRVSWWGTWCDLMDRLHGV